MDIVNYILGNRYKGSGGYDKTTTLSWDGVLTDDEKTFGPYDSDEEQVYFYKISDEPLSSDAFRNSITTIALTKTGEIRSLDAAKDHCIIGTDDEILMNICAMTLNVFIEKDMFKRGLFISKIIKKSDDNDAIYVKSISYKTPIPIQNKFIPLAEDGVKGGIVGTAKTDDMLTPVGIDESGKLFAESQFYDTRDTKDLVMTFDGNLEGKEYIEIEPGAYLVKYSDYVPPYDSVNYINVTFASNESERKDTIAKEKLDYISDDTCTGYMGPNGSMLNFIYSGSVSFGDEIVVTQGTWVGYYKGDDFTNIYKEITINYNVGELKQIDKKYIPEQKPLTFTGAVTGSYDGSEPLTVEIPSGADGSPGKDGADGKSAYQYAQDGGYTGTETEFAAKLAEEMPGALPNPNALTFMGAATGTYDGSAPLTVNIPAGGGGTGGSSEWKLLTDITLTEASAIAEVKYDTKYKTMYAYFRIPKVEEKISTGNSICLLHSNALYYVSIGDPSYNYCIEIICDATNQTMLEFYCARKVNGIGVYSPWQQRSSPLSSDSCLPFKIKSNIELPAGTVLRVYGRE